MIVYKVILKSDTASFRNELTSTSLLETFNCPPLSTIYGLIAAAYGQYRYDVDIGYYFEFNNKQTDFELVLRQTDNKYRQRFRNFVEDNRFDRNDILRGCFGTVPVRREILFGCRLVLYLKERDVAESFEKPFYALALGRLEDLAVVSEKIKRIDINIANEAVRFGKTILPFQVGKKIPGRITKLNIQLSDSEPRIVKKADLFNIVDRFIERTTFDGDLYYDRDENIGIYFHKGVADV
jgi:CRISPR-associated protein Cas5t